MTLPLGSEKKFVVGVNIAVFDDDSITIQTSTPNKLLIIGALDRAIHRVEHLRPEDEPRILVPDVVGVPDLKNPTK